MYKIAIIEEFHKSGLKLFDNNNQNFKYDIINDASENNLKKLLPQYDGCTLREFLNLQKIFCTNVIN